MADEPVWQWQHLRIGSNWEDIPEPHPNSPLGFAGDALRVKGSVYDDGMGNQYRRVWVCQHVNRISMDMNPPIVNCTDCGKRLS